MAVSSSTLALLVGALSPAPIISEEEIAQAVSPRIGISTTHMRYYPALSQIHFLTEDDRKPQSAVRNRVKLQGAMW